MVSKNINVNDVMLLLNSTAKRIEDFSKVFGIPVCEFKIGGSLALCFNIPGFTREPHDIDLIVPEKYYKKFVNFANLVDNYSKTYSRSFTFHSITIYGHEVNILFESKEVFWRHVNMFNNIMIQDPTLIKYAKMNYAKNGVLRDKDVKDINMIIEWEFENNFPF